MGSTNYFENEIRLSLNEYKKDHKEFTYHRLYDTTTFRSVSENMFCIKNPCDYIAINKGQFYCIECKSSHSPTSYSMDYIKPHQITMMKEWEECGAKSFFLINNRNNPRDITCYLIPLKLMEDIYESSIIRNECPKSIKWGLFEEMVEAGVYGVKKIRREKGLWKDIFNE